MIDFGSVLSKGNEQGVDYALVPAVGFVGEREVASIDVEKRCNVRTGLDVIAEQRGQTEAHCGGAERRNQRAGKLFVARPVNRTPVVVRNTKEPVSRTDL